MSWNTGHHYGIRCENGHFCQPGVLALFFLWGTPLFLEANSLGFSSQVVGFGNRHVVQVDQSLKPHPPMVTGPDRTQGPAGQSVFSVPLATVIGSGTSVGPWQAD